MAVVNVGQAPVQVTSGARSDFQQATREARHMVTECGMSEEIGPVFVENTESPDMRRRIDGEVSRILREAYHRVKTLLVSTHCHWPPVGPCKGLHHVWHCNVTLLQLSLHDSLPNPTKASPLTLGDS